MKPLRDFLFCQIVTLKDGGLLIDNNETKVTVQTDNLQCVYFHRQKLFSEKRQDDKKNDEKAKTKRFQGVCEFSHRQIRVR